MAFAVEELTKRRENETIAQHWVPQIRVISPRGLVLFYVFVSAQPIWRFLTRSLSPLRWENAESWNDREKSCSLVRMYAIQRYI